MFKRIGLFLLTNVAVLVVLGVVLNIVSAVFGINFSNVAGKGQSYGTLLIFGNRLAHEQRDDGTAETDNPRKYQKCPIALAFPGNVREVDSENGRNNVENNSEYNQNGYVGQEE